MPSYSISAVGSTPAIPVNVVNTHPNTLPSGVAVGLSNGAALTYTVQFTMDDLSSPSPYWFGLDNMIGLTASANATLSARVSAIRATITAYTSGTLTLAVSV